MMHECNVNCRTMDIATIESLGITDPGKWMPFCIELDPIYAIKMTSDDETDSLNNCTTIYLIDGDTYVIDTPFLEFKTILFNYKNQ